MLSFPGVFWATKPVAKDQRLGPEEIRARGDSYVRIDGRDYQLYSWSISGFTLAPYVGPLIRKQRAKVSLTVHDYHDPDGILRIDGEIVVWDQAQGFLRARWNGLTKYKASALERFYSLKRKVKR